MGQHRELPPLLRFLNDELGYAVRGGKPTLGFPVYYVDLAAWKLRLTSRTPLVYVSLGDLQSSQPQHLLLGEALSSTKATEGFDQGDDFILGWLASVDELRIETVVHLTSPLSNGRP